MDKIKTSIYKNRKMLACLLCVMMVAMISVVPALAAGDNADYANKVLGTVVTWASVICLIVLVIFLVLDVITIVKGGTGASIGKVVIKVILTLVIIGIMFYARSLGSNPEGLNIFQPGIEGAIEGLPRFD
jgi:uncharacterized membrane protein (DUF485 family)